jgi:hypothetical protein
LQYPPGFLNDDINTPGILKLRARLSAILISRDHQTLTSNIATAAIQFREAAGLAAPCAG